jgi:hypothetical protein
MGIAPCSEDASVRRRNLAGAKTAFGDAAFDAAWSEGLSLDHGAAMSPAIGERELSGRETLPQHAIASPLASILGYLPWWNWGTSAAVTRRLPLRFAPTR